MTRLLVCAFAAPIFVLAILAGGFDRAAAASKTPTTASMCATCIANCKGASICISHCKSRGCKSRGGPAVESVR
jgi:hypothetical protein